MTTFIQPDLSKTKAELVEAPYFNSKLHRTRGNIIKGGMNDPAAEMQMAAVHNIPRSDVKLNYNY